MGTYSFKSVGMTTDQATLEASAVTAEAVTYYSIATPLKLGTDREGIFHMHTSIQDQIADNVRNLLLTNWGERIGKYKFGANLKELTTEIVSQENFDSQAMARIRAAITQWMPYVNLKEFSSTIDDTDSTRPTGKIDIKVSYNINGINNSDRAIQVSLYII